MQVQAVHNVEQDMIHEKESFPTTFYALDSGERALYDNFIKRYRSILEFFAQYDQGMAPREERNSREAELGTLFHELITPTLAVDGFKDVTVLGTTYGERAEVMVHTMVCQLFNKEEPNTTPTAYQVHYSFHIEPGKLSCTSHIDYVQQQADMHHTRRTVIDDLIKTLLLQEQGDGITRPLTKLRGNGFYFASTTFAAPILFSIRKMLGALGKDAIEELEILLCSYDKESLTEEIGMGGRSTQIRKKLFKREYDSVLEREAIKSGFKEWKITERE